MPQTRAGEYWKIGDHGDAVTFGIGPTRPVPGDRVAQELPLHTLTLTEAIVIGNALIDAAEAVMRRQEHQP